VGGAKSDVCHDPTDYRPRPGGQIRRGELGSTLTLVHYQWKKKIWTAQLVSIAGHLSNWTNAFNLYIRNLQIKESLLVYIQGRKQCIELSIPVSYIN
jgi:hypothetical protein